MPFLRDNAGKFSPEKTGALLIALMPLALLAARMLGAGMTPVEPFGTLPGLQVGPAAGIGGALGGDLAGGARPLIEIIRFTGDWAIRLLLVTLLVTPARRLFNWPKLLLARRTLGLGAAFLLAIHFSFYVIDLGDPVMAAREIVLRIYLTIGFIALMIIAAMSATSWDGAVQWMGGARWAQLHALIYPATALGILHFFMQQKLDVTEPTLMAGLFVWLMGWRILQRIRHGTGLLPLLALAFASGVATALLEAGWYLAATGIDPTRVLTANLAFAYSIRPAWWVFAAGCVVALASTLALRLRPLPARRERAV